MKGWTSSADRARFMEKWKTETGAKERELSILMQATQNAA